MSKTSYLDKLKANAATLTQLNLSRQNLGTDEVKQLANALNSNSTLTVLDLSFNKFVEQGSFQGCRSFINV